MKTVTVCTFVCLFSLACYCDVPIPTVALTVDQAQQQLDTDHLRVHFIDIGPGLAVLIQTPQNRRNIFIDGGKWGLSDMMEYVAEFVPDDDTMDLAIVTHADYDHYSGMGKIFTKYDVGEFWYTGYTSEDLERKPAWSNFLEQVESEEDCVVRNPVGQWKEVGDTIVVDTQNTPATDDDIKIVLLNVDSQPPHKDAVSGRSFQESQLRNNASLVFRLVYGEVSFLFTGDINGRDDDSFDPNEIDSEELELWVRHTLYGHKYSLKADVLQVSHHGSNGASSLRFLQAVSPEWAVITAGHAYDHPRVDTLSRLSMAGIKTLRTDAGDSTPENAVKDPRGDDCYVFETDGTEITRLLKVAIE